MKFFSRELCEKLQKLGCKSESGKIWYFAQNIEQWCLLEQQFKELAGNHVPAFEQNDFTGCHEQARENARIVWGDGKQFYCPCCEQSEPPYESQEHNGNEEDCFNYKLFYYHRHVMIDAPDAVEYLKETMQENPK